MSQILCIPIRDALIFGSFSCFSPQLIIHHSLLHSFIHSHMHIPSYTFPLSSPLPFLSISECIQIDTRKYIQSSIATKTSPERPLRSTHSLLLTFSPPALPPVTARVGCALAGGYTLTPHDTAVTV